MVSSSNVWHCVFVGIAGLLLTNEASAEKLDSRVKSLSAVVPNSQKVTVGITPFTSEEKQSGTDEQRRLARFEESYLVGRLMQVMQQSPRISKVYVVSETSPSVDFNIAGEILESDGVTTRVSLAVTRCDGETVLKKSYGVKLKWDSFFHLSDPSSTIWVDVTNDFDQYLEKTWKKSLVTIPNARVFAFANSTSKPKHFSPETISRALNIAESGRALEREKFLDLLTNNYSEFTNAFRTDRIAWEESVVTAKHNARMAKTERFWAGFALVTTIAAAGVDSYVSGTAGVSPNTATYTGLASTLMTAVDKSGDIANQYSDLSSALTGTFADSVERTVVVLDNVTVELEGTRGQQVARLRALISEKVESCLATS